MKKAIFIFIALILITSPLASASLSSWFKDTFLSPCYPNMRVACDYSISESNIYWYDSCGNKGALIYSCATQFPDRPKCRHIDPAGAIGECAQCIQDSHCPSGQICQSGVCSSTTTTPTTTTPTTSTRDVQFRIRDAINSQNIEEARIEIWVGSTKITGKLTEVNGLTSVIKLNVGTQYTFIISKSGYETKTTTHTIVAGDLQELIFILNPLTNTAQTSSRATFFSVKNSITNTPIQDASIDISREGTYVTTKMTGADGKTSPLSLHNQETHSLIISKSGYETKNIRLIIPLGTTTYNYPIILTPAREETKPEYRDITIPCTDTDSSTSIPGSATKGSVIVKDTCQGTTTIKEAYCDANGEPALGGTTLSCGVEKRCIEDDNGLAYCTPLTERTQSNRDNSKTPKRCTDTSPDELTAGSATDNDETIKDKCVNRKVIREAVCEDGVAVLSNAVNCDSAYRCKETNEGAYCKPANFFERLFNF
ncbi:MAG: hypothetical protein ABIG28_02290 [archaeon]